MLSRVVAGRGDERAVKSATAASTVSNLCDVYTQNDLEDKWKELLTVYDVRLAAHSELPCSCVNNDTVDRHERLLRCMHPTATP